MEITNEFETVRNTTQKMHCHCYSLAVLPKCSENDNDLGYTSKNSCSHACMAVQDFVKYIKKLSAT